MTKFVARIVAAAALAAVPLVGFGAAAAATPGARIVLSDIDFSRADHLATFNARVGAVQRHFCVGPKRSVADRAACRQAVRDEIISHLTRQQQLALGAASPSRG